MSSSDHDSHLAGWLPQLEVYRAAMDSAPKAVPKLPEFSIQTCVAEQTSIAESSSGLKIPSGTSDAALPLSQIIHLPMDGILKRIKGSKPFVLGIGTVGESDPSLVRSVVTDLVVRCCSRIDRNAILITVRPPHDLNVNDSVGNVLVREARWSYFADTKAEMKTWQAQLAELPRWKQEFGLIVFDLGDVCFPRMPQIGRLCDGIVVQLLNPSNSRETIQALRSLQKNRMTILGAWSVELSAQDIAA